MVLTFMKTFGESLLSISLRLGNTARTVMRMCSTKRAEKLPNMVMCGNWTIDTVCTLVRKD